MGVTEIQKGDIIIIKVKGKLDATLSPEIEMKVFEFLNAGHLKLLLDFSEVNYINSAGFRTLLSIKKHVKSAAGTLIVFGLQTGVFEMMKICGFDHVLDISATEEEAIRRF